MTTALPILETERLRIRPFTLEDLDAVARVKNDAFGAEPLETHRRWLEWTVRNYTELAALFQPPYGDRAIVRKSDDHLIGAVGLVPSFMPFAQFPYWGGKKSLSTAEVGLFWAVETPYRGQGYAAEAARALIDYMFESMALARIVATTEYDNTSSQAVMRRLGMTIQRNPFPEPEWCQVVGILENDMKSL